MGNEQISDVSRRKFVINVTERQLRLIAVQGPVTAGLEEEYSCYPPRHFIIAVSSGGSVHTSRNRRRISVRL